MPLKDFQKFDWKILKTQGVITFELSDASCFYEGVEPDSPDLLEWVDYLKRTKKPFILATGTAYLGRSKDRPTTRTCLFTRPGWDKSDGQLGQYEPAVSQVFTQLPPI